MVTIKDLLYSETAQKNQWDNTPSNLRVMNNVQDLCSFLNGLEQILGVDLIVSSGYRSPDVNEAVGGSKSSYHMCGLAADISVENTGRCTLTDLKTLCQELRKTRLVEVIHHDTFVHIAIKKYFN